MKLFDKSELVQNIRWKRRMFFCGKSLTKLVYNDRLKVVDNNRPNSCKEGYPWMI